MVAVPWEELELNVTEGDAETFMLDVTQTDLEEAPVFDVDAWEYPVDADWDVDERSYWEVQ